MAFDNGCQSSKVNRMEVSNRLMIHVLRYEDPCVTVFLDAVDDKVSMMECKERGFPTVSMPLTEAIKVKFSSRLLNL